MQTSDYLKFEGIGKVFPGVKALDNITFGAKEGSVHGLIGENGAGKSTLLKILSGAHQPNSGKIIINGIDVKFANASAAIAAGVAVIYQELQLVPELTVAENIFLGHLPANNLGWVNKKELLKKAMFELERIGEKISPNTRLIKLSIAQRQMVEIAKALSKGAQIIAFDEPTSSLSEKETQQLFKIIADLKSQGKVVFYVSHRMEEIFKVCDAVTVFRDGQHVRTEYNMNNVDNDSLVKWMVGRELNDIYNYRSRQIGAELINVQNLTGPGISSPISFKVNKNEIIGFFGLVGAGRTELMRVIFGAEKSTGGDITLNGKRYHSSRPSQAIKNRIAYVPEDRKQDGILPIATVEENINVTSRPIHSSGRFWINNKWEHKNALEQIKSLRVKTPSAKQLMKNLSGGNQQKAILGRWLSEKVDLLLFDEPTRGIDVGAKSEIYDITYKLAEEGTGIIVVSSDLPEILGICDRIIVMREGKISGELTREKASPAAILKLALPVED